MTAPIRGGYHLLTLADPEWTGARIERLVDAAAAIKARPRDFASALAGRTLLMLFEKPSLRTRVSFEVGIYQLGGQAVHYPVADSPLGKKETYADAAQVLSRYIDLMMARLFRHAHLEELAAHSRVPVINALTDIYHPIQILSDLLTIREKKGRTKDLVLAYLGDANNNVTHSLMFGCARAGIDVRVGCPADPAYRPLPEIERTARELARASGASIEITKDAVAAVRGADLVYTDSWMSYHIPKDQARVRMAALMPYQVTTALMAHAKRDACFMNCLPAMRGEEQTSEVIDGPASIVFDQAENRLHMQKAVMIELVGLAEAARGAAARPRT